MTSPPTHYTRCPGCQTVFRVSAAQLALREGQVRCGNCLAVFDANRERVALAGAEPPQEPEVAGTAPEPAAESVVIDDAETPVADITEAHAPATETVATEWEPNEASPGETAETEAAETQTAAAGTAATETTAIENTAIENTATETAAIESTESPTRIDEGGLRSERFQWKPRKSLRERPKALYASAIVLLLVALAAQALFEYRNAIAARAPFMRPVLESACAAFGCTVEPLRDAAALSIDASDLRGDPAHRGLLKLSATIRNRASYPIAWPYLELTLTDSSDRVVARRAFPPDEYAGSASGVARGLPPNGEEVVTLFLDASATSQSGYRLYLFYP